MEDKFKRKNFHFFFNHNLNGNIKLVNTDNPLNNPNEFKVKGFFSELSKKNLIKKDIRGYPLINNNNNKQNILNNLNNITTYENKQNINNLLSSQPIEYNREIILDQISQMIDLKTKNKENNALNLKKIDNSNNNNNYLIPILTNRNTKKNIGERCFQKTKITSINSIKFSERDKNRNNNEILYTINKEEYNLKADSVLSYSYNEEKNMKSKMEDFHLIIDKYMGNKNKGYFSLFDGHGLNCEEPIKFAVCKFPNILMNNLNKSNYNIEESLINSFEIIDNELKNNFPQIENCGCTATIIYIDKELNIIYCANVGDSKSILINRNKNYINLTTEHKIENNIEENERIKNLGGIIFNNRLFGQLNLSRALGDFSLKNNGLISIPSIHNFILNEDDCFVVIASDGIWDCLNEDEITNLCFEYKNCNCYELGNIIVKKALEKGSQDNISCIIIQINNIY